MHSRWLLGFLGPSALLVATAEGRDELSSLQASQRRMRSTSNAAAQLNQSNNSCPVDQTGLLSASTACCYQKLVKDPNCCVDKTMPKGVDLRHFSRPDTYWYCNSTTGCFDSPEGPRGIDLMVTPHGASCSSPRILYVHGGSWMYGSPTTSGYKQFASRLALATGAVVFMNDYPLVPYGTFHTILESGIRALRWLAEHGPLDSCSRDERVPLFVAGDSSGGGTAMSLVLRLQQAPHLLPGQQLAGAFMFSPWTNLMCNTPEYYTNAFARIQSPETFRDLTPLQLFVGDIIFQAVSDDNAGEFSANALEYVGHDGALQTDPIASPYFAKPEHFSGKSVPPLFLSVGGSESILGDSVRVANVAAAGGADVTVGVYNGMWHVFPMYSEGCGSTQELWPAVHAVNATGAFVRRIVAKHREGHVREAPFPGLPLIQHFYDPSVDKFSLVGELIPKTAQWGYKEFAKEVSKEPWWVVLPSIGGSAILIFVSGVLVGAIVDSGGRTAYKRAKRVAEYRRKCVEVPVGYVNLDAIDLQGDQPTRLTRSFLMDFIMGVPEDVHNSWRVETVRAKADPSEAAARDAARAENAAWRRMALPGYQPPVEMPKAEAPKETLETGADARDLIAEVTTQGVSESWAVATTEAKEGTIEAARRENIAWRLQRMSSKEAS